MHPFRIGAASAFVLSIIPACAAAEPLTPAQIFGDSAPLQKFIILALVVAILAAVGIAIAKAARGQGVSAFVSGLRAGGPLLGVLGATYSALHGFIGLANVPTPPPLAVIAPGVAESLFVLGLGVLAGVVAVIGHWTMQARSSRSVAQS